MRRNLTAAIFIFATMSLLLRSLSALAKQESGHGRENTERFDAVSIVPAETGVVGAGVYYDPSRYRAVSVTVQRMILDSNQIQDWQLSGGPEWIKKDHFNVDATLSGAAGPDAVRAMVRAMLAERFGLSLSVTSRKTEVYELRERAGGAQLQEFGLGDRIKGPPAPGVMTIMPATKLTDFVRFLNNDGHFDKPVVDKTGLNGNYNLSLQIDTMPDSQPPGNSAAPQPSPGPPFALARPNLPQGRQLMDTINKQLGLVFLPATDLIEFFEISKINRPTP